jgi:FdhD protein
MMKVYEKRKIIRVTPQGFQPEEDYLIKEEVYKLIINDRQENVFHCTPTDIRQLAIGYCVNEGWLQCKSQLADLNIDEEKKQIVIKLTDNERQVKKARHTFSDFSYAPEKIQEISAIFSSKCELYRLTGASHSCALAGETGILIFMNDVARHNALDKVSGEMFLRQIEPTGKILVFSGRLAVDMIDKAINTGVRLLVAPGAPTLAAVEKAEKAGITLLGFVRKDNINIYTHWSRIRQK